MDGLAPPLRLCLLVRTGLETGQALNKILKDALDAVDCPLRSELVELIYSFERKTSPNYQGRISIERRALLDLLLAGLNGAAIVEYLLALEKELKLVCESEMDRHIARLPGKMLIPLLLFMFPALMSLILVPIVKELVEGLK